MIQNIGEIIIEFINDTEKTQKRRELISLVKNTNLHLDEMILLDGITDEKITADVNKSGLAIIEIRLGYNHELYNVSQIKQAVSDFLLKEYAPDRIEELEKEFTTLYRKKATNLE